MSTIVLTGGGTAGHVMPNLALLPELEKVFNRIVYVGCGGMEAKLATGAGLPFFPITSVKLDRGNILKNAKIPFLLAKGIKDAKKLLKDLRPDVVFSKGGYVALPTCLGANSLKIPVVVHESDYTLGVANKITARKATKVITSFAETTGGHFIGNPVRAEIVEGNADIARRMFAIDRTKKTILVVGGSLGSQAINNVIYKSLPILTKSYNIIHIAGKTGEFSINFPNYFQLEYSKNINDLYAVADFVVCRGGANTLSEVATLGKRCVVIPLPKHASRGDQELNARSYEKRGFVEVLLQEELFVESLIAKIESIRNKIPPKLDISEINKRIVNEIVSAVGK